MILRNGTKESPDDITGQPIKLEATLPKASVYALVIIGSIGANFARCHAAYDSTYKPTPLSPAIFKLCHARHKNLQMYRLNNRH